MKRWLFVLTVSAASCARLAAGFGDGDDGRPADAGIDGGTSPSSTADAGDVPTPLPKLTMRPDTCLSESEIFLHWKPVSEAVEYELGTSSGRTARTTGETIRYGGYDQTVTVTALGRSGVPLARETLTCPLPAGGDVLELLVRRGGEIVNENIACIKQRVATGGPLELPTNVWNLATTGGAPHSLRGAASLMFTPPPRERPPLAIATGAGLRIYSADRGIALGADSLAVPDLSLSPEPALAASDRVFYGVLSDDAVFAFPFPVEGGGVSAVLTSAALSGRRILGIYPALDGVWIAVQGTLSDGGTNSELLHYSAIEHDVEPDTVLPLPDARSSDDFLFDPVGLLLANRSGDQQIRAGIVAGTDIAWSVIGQLPPGTESLRSSTSYIFAAGSGGVSILSRANAESLLRVQLEGVSAAEVVGYLPVYSPSTP